MKIKRFLPASLLALMLIAFAVLSPALVNADVVLTDGNSTAAIDPTSQGGMYNWSVNGANQLFQQWFWYRIGSTGTPASIDNLNTLANPVAITPFLGSRGVDLGYSAPSLFNLGITYTLTGGVPSSTVSDIVESIRITNTSGAALDFHFYQYSDFDLGGNSVGDTATHVNDNLIRQTKGPLNIQETVVTPAPSHWQIADYPELLTSLELVPVAGLTLTDSPDSLTGDIAYALEWDVNLASGASFIISKDKRLDVVPVPPSALLLGSGLLGLLALRGRRKGQ